MSELQGEKTEQPQPIAGMTIPQGGNRNSKNLPLKPNGQREWSNGLLDCFSDCGTCCMSWCCPCLVYSKLKHRVEYLNANGKPHPEEGGSGLDGDCLLHYCFLAFHLHCIPQMSNRNVIRQRYNIDGSSGGDCLTAAFCTPCELTQESREIALEEESLRH